MSEPREITDALAAIEVLSGEAKPTPEREKQFWFQAEANMRERYQQERVRRRILEIGLRNLETALKNKDAVIVALQAQLNHHSTLANTWRSWGLLMGAIAAVALGLLIGKCL